MLQFMSLKSIAGFNKLFWFAVGTRSEVRKVQVSNPGYGEYTIYANLYIEESVLLSNASVETRSVKL